MSKIETLVKNNEHLYPRTVEKAIYDDNGGRLDNKINQLKTDVDILKGKDIKFKKVFCQVSSNNYAIGGYYGVISKNDIELPDDAKIIGVDGINYQGYPAIATYLDDEQLFRIACNTSDGAYFFIRYI